MAHSKTTLIPEGFVGLPVLVASPSDVGRLMRELEQVDNALHQAKLRGHASASDAKVSKLLDATFQLNKLSVENAKDRQHLASFLAHIKQSAPVLHMSFSADPDMPFMEKLIAYLRKEIHPIVLVTVGLQPNIGAGCIVRSTNKYFDLSLRKDFERHKDVLLAKIKEVAGTSTAVPAFESVAAAPVATTEPVAVSRRVAPVAKEIHA